MSPQHPYLTKPDVLVLDNLTQSSLNHDICPITKRVIATSQPLKRQESYKHSENLDDIATIEKLKRLNDPRSSAFEPTILTSWDVEDVPKLFRVRILEPYNNWAKKIVRRPTDVVFLTHILLYCFTSVPSALLLFWCFTWPHAIFHWLMQAWYCGAFTLLLHNHIHNNGVLAKRYAWVDKAWPYILEPLMGHTWDSYFYHHVKHHHVEGNGPGDLSSTIRYQRDSLSQFLHYVGRFLFLVWIELPLYFIRKRKYSLAIRTFISEISSYATIAIAARYNFRASLFTLIVPLIQMRIGMMVGNWGQHALVDEIEPDSDFRSSITLIDVASNRHCFNDGYHTSHHLNPRRHWRDHPLAFTKAKAQYIAGRALVFKDIDYIMMTVTLLRKDYMYLAGCLVPIGEQAGMSQVEIAEMLRSKTKRFSEEEIRRKFGKVE